MEVQDEKSISSKEALSQLFLGYLNWLPLIESAFCPASKLKSRLCRPPFYSSLYGLCDGPLYPVSSLDLQCLGAVDLYALDSDRWPGDLDLYRYLLYGKPSKAQLQGPADHSG